MRSELYLIAVITIIVLRAQCQRPEADCIKGPSRRYNGTRSTTTSGRTCQRWDSDIPHKVKTRPLVDNHNYCRNPDNDLRGTWCYTTDLDTRWEYCNITKCPEDSYLYWTSYDSARKRGLLLKAHADPEVVKITTDATGKFNTTIVVNSSDVNSEYWALTVHPRKKQLYYTDYRISYLAVWDINKGEETRYFEGITHGIESLAIDWKTDNLYWTDSTFKWIMAADSQFKHYAPVHRTTPDPPYALAIHSERRYMIFATYKSLNSKIVRTDLAGKNAVVLFKHPNTFDVTGITVDYEEDRFYWNDFTGYGSYIMSSRFDGTNKTQHHYIKDTIFWASVTFNDYIYSSDVHAKYNIAGEQSYYIWFMAKRRTHKYRYQLSQKPRGISIYQKSRETLPRHDLDFGDCSENNECDHICIPNINSSSECFCSLGYQFDSTTKRCIYNLLEDSYLLLADSGQGKVYQIPIDGAEGEKSTLAYNIVPLDDVQNIRTVTLDVKRGYVFWSSKKTRSLYRSNVDGTNRMKIADVYAKSMAVDPQTGYIFYVDKHTNAIIVSKGDGSLNKTVKTSNSTAERNSTIKMITIDIEYKYVYWTEQFTDGDTGRMMRCRFDGSGIEVVLDGLKSPHAITIDYQTSKIYVVEANQPKIFETKLSLLETISNTSTTNSNIRVYDLARDFKTPYILDIKIFGGTAYIADGKDEAIRTFDLSSQLGPVPYFGPPEFVSIKTISIFKKSYYTDFIEPIRNPCSTDICQGLCLALNANDSVCLCRDGNVDSDCATKEDTATTEVSTNAMVTDSITGRSQPYHTTSVSPTSHEDLDVIVNRFWANILRVIILCNSENSPCFQ